MFDFPIDALPPNPATVDPTLDEDIDPMELPTRHFQELDLLPADEQQITYDCARLEEHGLWDQNDCCGLCHSYHEIAPEPLRYRHITVRGCCHAHEALDHLAPPPNDFLACLFST